ncbi:MAG: hypothetical protein RR766_05395 [Longicatena sp.]
MFQIDTRRFQEHANAVQNGITKTNQLIALTNQLNTIEHVDVIQRLKNNQSFLVTSLRKLYSYYINGQDAFDEVERTILSNAQIFENDTFSHSLHGDLKVQTFDFSHRFHTTLRKDRNLLEYVRNGACVGAFVGFDALRIKNGFDKKYVKGEASLNVGSVKLSGDIQGVLFKNKKIDPTLYVDVGASAVLGKAATSLRIGNDNIYAQGDARVGVGVVSGSAKAVINKEEITLKASVGAAAVRGEIKGCISLFGWKITATGIGELGSAGASTEFSSKKGEFEFGAKVSLIAGLGFRIKVSS